MPPAPTNERPTLVRSRHQPVPWSGSEVRQRLADRGHRTTTNRANPPRGGDAKPRDSTSWPGCRSNCATPFRPAPPLSTRRGVLRHQDIHGRRDGLGTTPIRWLLAVMLIGVVVAAVVSMGALPGAIASPRSGSSKTDQSTTPPPVVKPAPTTTTTSTTRPATPRPPTVGSGPVPTSTVPPTKGTTPTPSSTTVTTHPVPPPTVAGPGSDAEHGPPRDKTERRAAERHSRPHPTNRDHGADDGPGALVNSSRLLDRRVGSSGGVSRLAAAGGDLHIARICLLPGR